MTMPLFISRAPPAPDVPVHQPSFKWWMLPRLAGGSNHVYVAVEQKGWGVALTLQPGYQVGAVRGTSDDRAVAPSFSKQVGYIGDAFPFIAGRVGGVEADEPLQKLHRIEGGALALLSKRNRHQTRLPENRQEARCKRPVGSKGVLSVLIRIGGKRFAG
jgi:hypothetical protein